MAQRPFGRCCRATAAQKDNGNFLLHRLGQGGRQGRPIGQTLSVNAHRTYPGIVQHGIENIGAVDHRLVADTDGITQGKRAFGAQKAIEERAAL